MAPNMSPNGRGATVTPSPVPFGQCETKSLKRMHFDSAKRKLSLYEQFRQLIGPEDTEESIVRKYHFRELLGSGATSNVYRAIEVRTGRQVAIKVFDKAKMIQTRGCITSSRKYEVTEPAVFRVQRRLKKIINEIKILKQLKHPNIVEYLGAFETDHRIGIVHELVEGGDLFNFVVDSGRLEERLVANICSQLVDALGYCHSKNIWHRDLKLENVLITKDKQVKLIDFGLSELTRPNEKLRTICGTPLYCCPEMFIAPMIAKRHGFYGAPADIWSIGILMFALSTGCAPFNDSTVLTLKREMCRNKIAYPNYMTYELKSLIKSILCYDSTQRISLREIQNHEWVLSHSAPRKTIRVPKNSNLASFSQRNQTLISSESRRTTDGTDCSYETPHESESQEYSDDQEEESRIGESIYESVEDNNFADGYFEKDAYCPSHTDPVVSNNQVNEPDSFPNEEYDKPSSQNVEQCSTSNCRESHQSTSNSSQKSEEKRQFDFLTFSGFFRF